MNTKIILAVVAVLTLGAGVAYAATQTASGGTTVCVNNTNGLILPSASGAANTTQTMYWAEKIFPKATSATTTAATARSSS